MEAPWQTLESMEHDILVCCVYPAYMYLLYGYICVYGSTAADSGMLASSMEHDIFVSCIHMYICILCICTCYICVHGSTAADSGMLAGSMEHDICYIHTHIHTYIHT
jgi:hypothetical protein